MEKQSFSEAIKSKAVEIFSEHGYHGATIRMIANAAECSLPMLYYYYNNKSSLFEEVAYHEFIRLTEKLNSSIVMGTSLEDIYFQAVKQRKELNPYDKGVFKLALKVWLGFETNKEVRNKLITWESDRFERTKKLLSVICSDEAKLSLIANLLNRTIENMTEKIILLDEDISDEIVRKEIRVIISLAGN